MRDYDSVHLTVIWIVQTFWQVQLTILQQCASRRQMPCFFLLTKLPFGLQFGLLERWMMPLGLLSSGKRCGSFRTNQQCIHNLPSRTPVCHPFSDCVLIYNIEKKKTDNDTDLLLRMYINPCLFHSLYKTAILPVQQEVQKMVCLWFVGLYIDTQE